MIKLISSVKNPTVQRLKKLREESAERRETRRFIVEGRREALRAIQCGFQCLAVYAPASEDWSLWPIDVEKTEVTKEVLEKIGLRSQEPVSVFDLPDTAMNFDIADPSMVLVLDGLEKPGNLGAIYRTADAAGVSLILLVGQRIDLFNPHAIRASLGTCFSVPSLQLELQQAQDWLRARCFTPIVLDPKAEKNLLAAELPQRSALVIGSEDRGVDPLWLSHPSEHYRLPMLGIADSLNASVTAAIVAYHFRRQYPSSSKSY